mgnify:CR=1 FL=1
MSSHQLIAEGVTNPPIDDLLTKTDSKYKLVLYSAKRARQINAYYSQLGEGLLEYVGPLVDTHVQEKPLSIALREINEGKLVCEDIDPNEVEAAEPVTDPIADFDVPVRHCGLDQPRLVWSGQELIHASRGWSWASAVVLPPTRPANSFVDSPSPITM